MPNPAHIPNHTHQPLVMNNPPTYPINYAETGLCLDWLATEINNQCQYHTIFDQRIGKVEMVTQNIDSKMDRVLGRLETSLPTPQKLQKTTTSSFCDLPSSPGGNSLVYNRSGPMELCLP
jgi:hypothetical protein